MRTAFLAIITAVTTTTALAQPGWAQQPPVEPAPAAPPPMFSIRDSKVGTLPNDLRYLLVREPMVPEIHVELWFKTGSADLPEELFTAWPVALLASLEHNEWAAVARAWEWEIEFELRPDATVLRATAPSSQRGLMKKLLRAWLTIEPLDAERFGVLNDLKHALGWNKFGSRDAFRRTFFAGHPYGRTIEDWLLNQPDPSLDAVNRIRTEWLVPASATLVLLGDVDPERDYLELIWPLAKLDSPPAPPTVWPDRLPDGLRTGDFSGAPLPQSRRYWLGYRTPPLGFFENAAIDVLLAHVLDERIGLFGDYAKSRRHLEDRETFEARRAADPDRDRETSLPVAEPPLRVQRHVWRDEGFIAVVSSALGGDRATAQKRLDGISGKIRAEFRRLQTEPLSAERLQLARAAAQATLVHELSDTRRRAYRLAEAECLVGNARFVERLLPRLEQVGVRDLMAAADTLLTGPRLFDRGNVALEETLEALQNATSTEIERSAARGRKYLDDLQSRADALRKRAAPPAAPELLQDVVAAAIPDHLTTFLGAKLPGGETIAFSFECVGPWDALRTSVYEDTLPAPLIDYATMHAITIELDYDNIMTRSRWRVSGPADALAQLVGVVVELRAALQIGSAYFVSYAGPHEPRAVAELLRETLAARRAKLALVTGPLPRLVAAKAELDAGAESNHDPLVDEIMNETVVHPALRAAALSGLFERDRLPPKRLLQLRSPRDYVDLIDQRRMEAADE